MKAMIFGLLASFVGSTAVFAQDDGSLCHHAGLTYSPSSLIAMGSSIQRCAVTQSGVSVWTPVVSEDKEAISANCVSGGREFGQGSLISAGSLQLQCSRGIWYPS